jgi:DNA-binding Lrp family transcriptional regulator
MGAKREWTDAELEIVRQYAEDPDRSIKEAMEALGCTGNTVRKLLKRLGIPKWIKSSGAGWRTDPALAARLKDLADDPNVSIGKAHKVTGVSPKAIDVWMRETGNDWAYTARNLHVPESEWEQIETMASDPTVSIPEAARALGIPEGTLNSRIRARKIKWVGKTKRHYVAQKDIDIGLLRRQAKDNRISMAEAAKAHGVNPTTLAKRLKQHGIKWLQGRPAPAVPIKSVKREVSKPVVVKRKPVPKVDTPDFVLEPCGKMGVYGFSWRCDFLQARGWKAGTDREKVEAELRRDLAYPTSRHSTVIAREGMAA